MMDKIEEMMNAMTDNDMGWWPLVSLRPSKDKDIDNQILLKLSLSFGSIFGFLILAMIFFMSGAFSLPIILISFIVGWGLFFISYKYTYAYFWNRRARRLRNG